MSKSGNLTIVIQAGGESRRMGRSKATVPFLGEPLLLRGVNRLLPLADEFIITTNEPENLGFLDDWVDNGRIRLVRDLSDTRGALHGVHTALEAATHPFVAMVACDMIFPSRSLISAEFTALKREGTDAVVPKTQFGYEPFHGVYYKEACLPAVIEALQEGQTRATSWFDKVKVTDFTTDMIAEVEPRGGCFINANTPEELAAVERKIVDGGISERENYAS